MKKIFFILWCIWGFLIFNQTQAYFNMTVSPIKYEIEAEPGDIVVKSATLYNYSDERLEINTSTAEFIADGNSGQPRIVPAQNQNSISHWITLHTDNFTLEPKSQKTINFDIFIPDNATPGGHYWAVFFENDAKVNTAASGVWVNVDYGVLLLVNVAGEIIKDGEAKPVNISSGWNSSRKFSTSFVSKQKDNCPLWDFSRSNFDGLCIDKINKKDEAEINIDLWEISDIISENKNTNTIKSNDKSQEEWDLDITFEVPFENKWNTHIKPNGKIILKDENGKQIKWVGKELILNDNGAIIGEKIVDYIPINDIWWNVLPQTNRTFEWEWKWFPYKTYDDEWNEIIRYSNPSDYYSEQNFRENTVLNFWERVLERKNEKTVTAQVEVSYEDINGEDVEFNSAEEFTIEYVDTYVWLNKYVVTSGGFILFIGSIFYIIWYFRKKKCKKCWRRIKRHLKACPYCGKKQKEKDETEEKNKKKKKKKKKKEL